MKLAKDRLAKLAYSPRLAHLVASNDFFSRLVRACRNSDDVSVTHWWGEDRTRRRWGQFVWPDAFGQVQHSGRKQSFFLELDLGTERPWRLAAKLDGYRGRLVGQAVHRASQPGTTRRELAGSGSKPTCVTFGSQ
ncbi:MAG: replication-relaxation family protein [Actinomycetota bacterium]